MSVTAQAGGLRLTSDRANGPGVATEVLLQPLASAHRRTYAQRYRSAGFHAFAPGEPWTLGVGPGFWAVATRFVLVATGEATALIEQGVAQVEAQSAAAA